MLNIILLGSNGKIGKYFLKDNKNKYNIFTDKQYPLNSLLNSSFLNNNNINCIINCIGSYEKADAFFHSNFFLPLEITKELVKYTNLYEKKITFIHFSSIGVNDPYGRMTLEPFELSLSERKLLNFNNYELSKCCCDYSIKHILKDNTKINTFLLQPSIILFNNSKFLNKLFFFLIIFPLNLSPISFPPFTRIKFLINKTNEILTKAIPDQKGIVTVQCYKRESIESLFPQYKYFSFLKFNPSKKKLSKIIFLMSKFKFFNPMTRIIKFLCFL